MDIQIAANFERYLFEASGRDAALIRAKMRALQETGSFDLGSLGDIMRREFAATAASESDVAEAIVRIKAESGYVADPHTACAIVAAERELADSRNPQVMLSTAHPAKFPDAMQAITGERPALPARLGGLLAAKERFTTIDNDIGAAEAHVESLTRAVLETRG
jgi:threonine synthase